MTNSFIWIRSLVLPLLLFASLPNSYAATAKGKLIAQSPQSYKIVSVHKNAAASVATVSSSGGFSAKIKKGSTLQLVDSSGRYQGPLLAAKNKKAYAVLSGKSGNIGKFKIKKGFAVSTHNIKSAPFYSSKEKIAFNARSGPKGANKFGFVRIKTSSIKNNIGTKANEPQEGEDMDGDGLPDLLDIDDDGDLKLDVVDEVPHKEGEFQGETFSTLRLDLVDSLNVNAGSISDTLIDELISEHLILRIGVRNNGTKSISAVNVDCQSLSYCSPQTGTGTIRMDNGPLAEGALWRSYDPDEDGFPNLQIVNEPIQATIGIRPHATRDELKTGDTILMSVKNSDDSSASVPAVIPFVFLTAPALKQYSNGEKTTQITYPVTQGADGTSSLHPFVLSDGKVNLTFWKPQRKNIEGAESEGYYDMGGLSYGVSLSLNSGVYTCNADEYSEISNSLTKRTEEILGTAVLRDSALDSPASETNTLSYTIDMGACLTRQGVNTSGAFVTMALEAVSDAHDSTSQFLYFKLP